MLVLTRRVDEGVVIGDNIRIRVIAIEGNKVKLGITADKAIPVIREEIIELVKNENLAAGKFDDSIFDLIGILPHSDNK